MGRRERLTREQQRMRDEEELRAFNADLERLQFWDRVQKGLLSPQEQADWDELMDDGPLEMDPEFEAKVREQEEKIRNWRKIR